MGFQHPAGQSGHLAGNAPLIPEDEAALDDLYVHSDAADGMGPLHISGTTHADDNLPLTVMVRCAKDGAEKAAATLPVQAGAFAGTLTIPAPELWYPNGLGEQPLYDVTLTLRNGETVLDERTMRQGIRHFEMIQNEDAPTGALPYTIIMNGERVYMKGVNITPMDHIYGDIPAEQVAYQLHQAKRLNVNIVRVWGGGVIETETFYRLCDELGLLVWQEFIQSSSGVDNIPSGTAVFTLLRQSAVHALKVKRNHTSLVIWSGGNELMDENRKPMTLENKNIAMLADLVRNA